jgi:HPr kinase/phosphorylase
MPRGKGPASVARTGRPSGKASPTGGRTVRTTGTCPQVISGGLLQIFGIGVLIVGDSGLGKSESALELVSRGHLFVSDDVVAVRLAPDGTLIGRAPAISRDFMEIRGLGIINIRQIFGPKAVCNQTRIDLIVQLKKWQRGFEYDRLGLEFSGDFDILGVRVPRQIVPVAPGRNIATLIEVASKVHLLREKGYHASRDIVKKLNRALL